MEYNEICSKIIDKEMKNFVHEVKKHCTFEYESTALFTENFNVPYNRCVYFSRYANSCLYVFKDSIEKFLSDCPDAKGILSEWKSHAEVKVCSLSTGPGLDYFAFMLGILEYDPLPPNFSGAKVISKYGAWKNSANIMLEVLREKGTVCGIHWSKFNYNIEITQTDDLLKCFSEETNVKNQYLLVSDTHIILMMRALNLYAFGSPQETAIFQMLKELISSLRSDATLICVDTIPSLALFNQALSCFPGKFLYGPIHQACKIPVNISNGEKCCSETRFNGTFFVWRKLPFTFTKFTSLEMTQLGTDGYERKNPSSVDEIYASIFTDDNSKQNIKTSEILPWRELPKCKIPWGKVFWQNASPTVKKSLKSIMSFNKESMERHWIGEVANLYMKEFGTSTFSNLSEEAEKVEIETSDECNKESSQMVNEISSITSAPTTPHGVHIPNDIICDGAEVSISTSDECNKESSQMVSEISSITSAPTTPHGVHIPNDIICDGANNTESIILGKSSLSIVASNPSSDFVNATIDFSLKPIKQDLATSNKGEIPMSEPLKLSISDADVINLSPIKVIHLNIDCKTENEDTVYQVNRNRTPFFKTNFSKADKRIKNLKASEILPWRKLPPCEIPWGKIFWQNASPRMKNSLKSLLSLKKETIEHHWIGEVVSLYLEEFGSRDISKLTASNQKSTLQSMHKITKETEISNSIFNHFPSQQSDCNLKNFTDHNIVTESIFLRENYSKVPQSSTSLNVHDKASNSDYQPMKCDFAIPPTCSFFQDLKKGEIEFPVQLEEKRLSNPTHVKTNANDSQKLLINTIQTMVSKVSPPAENKRIKHVQPRFETKSSQTDRPEKIDHASIETLAESIKQLVTSVERITQLNQSNNCNKTHFHENIKSCHHQLTLNDAAKTNSVQPTCATNCFTNIPSTSSPKQDAQNYYSVHCRQQCCYGHCMKSLHPCYSQAYNRPSFHCLSSRKQLACSESHTVNKSPHIVIPLQNIYNDELLNIVSILKPE